MKDIEQVRSNLIRSLRKIITELHQINIDFDHWNRINPQYTPIDLESNRLALHAARQCLAKIVNRQNCEAEWNQMLEFMSQR